MHRLNFTGFLIPVKFCNPKSHYIFSPPISELRDKLTLLAQKIEPKLYVQFFKMKLRIKKSYQKFVYDFIKFDILVVCPNCSKKAIVKPNNCSLRHVAQSDVKIICPNCGYNKKWIDKPESIVYSSNNTIITGRYYVIGGAIDPFFYLPLWLNIDFGKYILWAYNLEHLEFLRIHIEAKLRERNGQEVFNKSLGSRLPKWITSKKNRAILLKKIDELKSK